MRQKRNNSSGDQIVQWRVSTNQENSYQSKVPINATLISATFAAIAIISLIFWIMYQDIYAVFLNATMITINALQLPLAIAFTTKHQKKTSKINPIVPRTLQFHGDDVNFEDQDNENETADQENLAMEAFIENLQNPRSPQFDEDPDHLFKSDDTLDISAYSPDILCSNATVENVDEISQLPGQVCYM